ncbi:ABC-2 type transporter [Dillenia turbinata]|uniref:ABC-2 type transporter n=1 Tax=Dillenia turbinata TaxID=194707 RepID=A0AAN8VWR2_9MAGN
MGSQATWSKQLSTLTKRSSVNMSRDVGYYWVRIIVYIILSLFVGTIFFDIGTSYNSIATKAGCGGFLVGFLTSMSIGGFLSLLEELKGIHREAKWALWSSCLSNFLSSFPHIFAGNFSRSRIYYLPYVEIWPGFSHFTFSCLDLLGRVAIVEGFMMIVASLVPIFLLGLSLELEFWLEKATSTVHLLTLNFFDFI